MKDYYSILGVPNDADPELIKSVYRSLSKIYHPDQYVGDKKFAEEKFKDINEAYECLKDPKKRENYDKEFNKEFSNNKYNDFKNADKKEDNNFNATVKKDWDVIIEFYEEIELERQHLSKIDKRIAMAFQVAILGYKSSNNWKEVSKIVVDAFFTKYFGEDTQIHRFVELLLLEKKIKIANEVNRAVKVLGDNDPEIIIEKIEEKYEDKLEFVDDNVMENWHTYFEDYEYRNHDEYEEFYEWLEDEYNYEQDDVKNHQKNENSTPFVWKIIIGFLILWVLVVIFE